MRPSGTPQELEQRRLRAVRLLREGFAPVEVARQIGVDRRSVRRWKAAARKGGANGPEIETSAVLGQQQRQADQRDDADQAHEHCHFLGSAPGGCS